MPVNVVKFPIIAVRHVVTQYSFSQFARRSIVWQQKEPLPRILQYKQIYRLFLLDRKYDTFTISRKLYLRLFIKFIYYYIILLQKHCTNWFKEVWKQTTICSSSVSIKETKHQTHLLTLHIVKNEINVQRFQPLLKKKWGVFFSAQVAHTSALGASL